MNPKLEVVPGDAGGREWLVIKTDTRELAATFHCAGAYDSGEAQRNAEAFADAGGAEGIRLLFAEAVEHRRVIRELRSAVEQLIKGYGLVYPAGRRAPVWQEELAAAFIFTPEQYRQQIEKIIGKETK